MATKRHLCRVVALYGLRTRRRLFNAFSIHGVLMPAAVRRRAAFPLRVFSSLLPPSPPACLLPHLPAAWMSSWPFACSRTGGSEGSGYTSTRKTAAVSCQPLMTPVAGWARHGALRLPIRLVSAALR